MKSERQIKRLAKKIWIEPDISVDERVLACAEAVLAKSTRNQAAVPLRRPSIWRAIMKNPVTKIAAAAVIIIAVLIGIHQLGGSTPAFADVVRPLLTARTATYKMTVNMEGEQAQTVEGMFMEPSRMRQVMPGGVIQIIDMSQGQMITLMPAEKKVMIVEMENVPEEQKGKVNMFHAIRDLIRQTDDESVEFIDEQKIDGVNAIGYHVGERNMGMTIWADAKTLLPIRIEYSMGEIMGMGGTVTMSDIVFDVELDESLFEVPQGYDVHTMQFDASMPSEEDFIQTLRLWSEATGGKFPSELNMKALIEEFFKVHMEKMGFKAEDGKGPDPSDPNFQELMQIYSKVARGIGFALRLPADSDFHYNGKDVKFGDAQVAVFWYRPEGSDTYRVIYGDLSVFHVLIVIVNRIEFGTRDMPFTLFFYGNSVGRIIMKSSITKLAAIIVVIVGLAICISHLKSNSSAIKIVSSPIPISPELVPIGIKLPKPMFTTGSYPLRVPNLEKPRSRPRPPFMAPAGTINIALGKPVLSSDDQPIIGEIEMITDGDKEAADGSYVEIGPFTQHVTIDLQTAYDIYAIVIWHYHKQSVVYFDVVVQVADDSDFITNVKMLFNNDIDNSAGFGVGKDMHYTETSEGKLIDVDGVNARYIRLYSNGNTANDMNHYIEVEVYGKPAKSG
ncbi:MAG: hypothetical protein ACYS17_03840 [Planctomycetota bacterium]|jgi:outer membrane lipoprotein-sorting protein